LDFAQAEHSKRTLMNDQAPIATNRIAEYGTPISRYTGEAILTFRRRKNFHVANHRSLLTNNFKTGQLQDGPIIIHRDNVPPFPKVARPSVIAFPAMIAEGTAFVADSVFTPTINYPKTTRTMPSRADARTNPTPNLRRSADP
jgi:hypothetical protein